MLIGVSVTTADSTSPLCPGDWVQVYGQVVDIDGHPDDIIVEFLSHSENYQGHILRSRTTPVDPPKDTHPCVALIKTETGLFARCERHHGLPHYATIVTMLEGTAEASLVFSTKTREWYDDLTAGYIEIR